MIREGYSFDDVLLVPRYSEVDSRGDIDVSPMHSLGSEDPSHQIPFIVSPMDTIAGPEMAEAVALWGGITIIHRFCSVGDQIQMLKKIHRFTDKWFAVGIRDGIERAKIILDKEECQGICVDVAHGHLRKSLFAVEDLRNLVGDDFPIIAGSVATKKGFADLQKAGATGVRVGIGSGSICSTRLVTGVGVPQLTAVMDCAEIKDSAALISDGGVRKPADAVKAIAAGADWVMAGGIFAGTDECLDPSTYRGMASKEAQSSLGKSSIIEGVSFPVSSKGSVQDVLETYVGGLRSAISYSGAHSIRTFQKCAKFIKVSPSSIVENQTVNFNNEEQISKCVY